MMQIRRQSIGVPNHQANGVAQVKEKGLFDDVSASSTKGVENHEQRFQQY